MNQKSASSAPSDLGLSDSEVIDFDADYAQDDTQGDVGGTALTEKRLASARAAAYRFREEVGNRIWKFKFKRRTHGKEKRRRTDLARGRGGAEG